MPGEATNPLSRTRTFVDGVAEQDSNKIPPMREEKSPVFVNPWSPLAAGRLRLSKSAPNIGHLGNIRAS
jgi:hypothetical protein